MFFYKLRSEGYQREVALTLIPIIFIVTVMSSAVPIASGYRFIPSSLENYESMKSLFLEWSIDKTLSISKIFITEWVLYS